MNTSETKKSTSLRLNRDLYSRIKKEAKRENRSINNFLETLIDEALEEKKHANHLEREISQSVRELNLIREGKLKGISSKSLLNEL